METGVINSTVFQTSEESTVTYETAEEHGSLDKDDFMQLFVTELQYQDPMEPMDSAEMASQVAQFNMVDLMYKNNEAMEEVVEAQNSVTAMNAVSMIGHDVVYQGDTLQVTSDGTAEFSVELEEPAEICNVVIQDSSGQTVASWDAGFMSSGKNDIEWDGLDSTGESVEEGFYTVSIQAINELDEEIEAVTWTSGTVDGISYDTDGQPELSINDGTTVGIDQIWMVKN